MTRHTEENLFFFLSFPFSTLKIDEYLTANFMHKIDKIFNKDGKMFLLQYFGAIKIEFTSDMRKIVFAHCSQIAAA